MNFIMRGLDRWAAKRQVEELQSFIAALARLSDSEMAELVVVVTHARNGMLQAGNNIMDPHGLWVRRPEVIIETVKTAEKFRAQNNIAAASAFAVWAHTLRAASRASMQPLAKLMWRELSRGFPHLQEAARNTKATMGVAVDISTAQQYPMGFDPRY